MWLKRPLAACSQTPIRENSIAHNRLRVHGVTTPAGTRLCLWLWVCCCLESYPLLQRGLANRRLPNAATSPLSHSPRIQLQPSAFGGQQKVMGAWLVWSEDSTETLSLGVALRHVECLGHPVRERARGEQSAAVLALWLRCSDGHDAHSRRSCETDAIRSVSVVLQAARLLATQDTRGLGAQLPPLQRVLPAPSAQANGWTALV